MPALENKLKMLKEDVAKNVSDEAEVSRLEGELKKAQNGMIFLLTLAIYVIILF